MDTPIAAEIQFYDIYDVWYTPWYKTYYFYGAVGVLCAAIVYVLYRWYKNRKAPVVQLSPQEKALHLIEHLKKTAQEPRHSYAILTHMLKVYLESCYKIPLVGKTDDEFLAIIMVQPTVSKETIDDLKIIFDGVTYIKFAGESTQVEQLKKALELSEKILKLSVIV